ILALAVSPPHAFVLTVSHGFWFIYSDLRRPSRRFSHADAPRLKVAPVLRLASTTRLIGQRPRVSAIIPIRLRALVPGHPAVLPIPRPARCPKWHALRR